MSLSDLYSNREFMTELKVCRTCHTKYTTEGSIGRLECRYHPGNLSRVKFTQDNDNVSGQPTASDCDRYICCNQPADPFHKDFKRSLRYGCTPADHTILPRPYAEEDAARLSAIPERSLFGNSFVVTFNSAESKYLLWRHDFVQAEYRLQYSTYSSEADKRLKQGMNELIATHQSVSHHTSDSESTDSDDTDDEYGYSDSDYSDDYY